MSDSSRPRGRTSKSETGCELRSERRRALEPRAARPRGVSMLPDPPPAPSPQPPVDRSPNGAWASPAGRTGQPQPRRQPAGPSDARPSPEGGVPRDSSPWNPNPGSWRPWGAVLGWIWPTPSDRCGSRGLPAPSRADSAVLRAPAGQPARRQRRRFRWRNGGRSLSGSRPGAVEGRRSGRSFRRGGSCPSLGRRGPQLTSGPGT